MVTFPLVAGTVLQIGVTLTDGNNAVVSQYPGTTPLTAKVWPGGRRSAAFAPVASWIRPLDGEVSITIQPTQTAGLDSGRYFGELVLTDPAQGPFIAYQWAIDLTNNSGAEEVAPSYCGFADLLAYGRSWVRDIQGDDDEAGFAEERGRARTWLDDLILSRFPGQGYSNLGDPGSGALAWGGSGNSTPNTYLRAQLDADLLIRRGWVVECTAKKALALICDGQIGPAEDAQQYVKLGRRYGNEAMSIALSNVAEIAGTNGQVTYSVNLGGGRVR